MIPASLELGSLTRDYGDFRAETRACRDDCALFDFSFMARARIEGKSALEALARLQPRSMSDLLPGRIRYALRLDDRSRVAADLTIWNIGSGIYEVMSGRRTDITDLGLLASSAARVHDLTESTCVYALQGPSALRVMAPLTDAERLGRLPYFAHEEFRVAGIECRIGRLGYTGEKGFEIVVPRETALTLWRQLSKDARPAGFAAADCLRIEAGFILFVNECAVGPTATELGLARFAPGSETDRRMQLVCFKAGGGIRPVMWQPNPADLRPPGRGTITVSSACQSPIAHGVLGLGFADPRDAVAGTRLRDPAGSFTAIEVLSLPFHDPGKRRPREPWSNDAPPRRQIKAT